VSTKERWAVYGLIVPFGLIGVILAVILVSSVSPSIWIPALGWVALTLGAVFVLGLVFHWFPGTPNDAEYDEYLLTSDPSKIIFCEGYESGWVKQPISTWSNLAFVAAGLLVALLLGTRPTPAPNPMADPAALIPLAYALALIFMGPGSMYFHASMKDWAGWFDNLSIILWAGLGLSYTMTRLLGAWFGAPLEMVWLLWGVIGVIVGVLTARSVLPSRTSQLVVAGSWFFVELLLMAASWLGYTPGFQRSTAWFIFVLLAFAAAFACWLPSGAVWRIWCSPASPIQGHGFWHLFAAIGGLLIYCYFASETALLSP
jgi:hypothetical protein